MRASGAAAGLGAVLALTLAGCGGSGAAATSTPGGCRSLDIVVTTSILGDVVSQVAGEGAAVEVLMPIGADPHSFQASASQAAALREADLVVVNGLGLEESLQRCDRGSGRRRGHRGGGGVVRGRHPVRRGGRWRERRRRGISTPTSGPTRGAWPTWSPAWGRPWPRPTRPARRRDRAAAAAYRGELLALDAEIERILAGIPAEAAEAGHQPPHPRLLRRSLRLRGGGGDHPRGEPRWPSRARPTWPPWPKPCAGRGCGPSSPRAPGRPPSPRRSPPNWESRSPWWACSPSPWARRGRGRRPTSACSELNAERIAAALGGS